MLFLLSLLAGALHVMAPDHWVPASILSWQRRWNGVAVVAFTALVMVIHLAMGIGLYFVFDEWFRALQPAQLFPVAMIFVFGMMILRGFRFSQIHEVQRLGPHSWWGVFSVVSLLGPCESIIPVLIKSSSLGVGYLLPIFAFFCGTVLAGSALVLSGQWVWNRPFWLTRTFDWVNQRVALLPVAASVVLGLRFLLRLT